MSWFNDLLRSPSANPLSRQGASGPTAAGAAAPADPDAARSALAAATDDTQRQRHAEDLGRALAQRLKAPLADDAAPVWAAAVSHVGDRSLSLQWLAGLSGDPWLGAVALHARYAETRLAAAQRIADHDVLEHVARLSRGRDKGVFRHCSDLLRQQRQSASRSERTARLAASLGDLLARTPLSVSGLLDLRAELQALEDGSESLAECRLLMDQADAHLKQESEARRRLQGCRDEAAGLDARCSAGPWPGPEQLQAWRERCLALEQARADLPGWLADTPAAQALAESLRQAEARLTAWAEESDRIGACERFLASLESGPVGADATAAWDALAKPDDRDIRTSLQARWLGLLAAHAAPVAAAAPEPVHAAERRPKPHVDTGAVRALLERMERALDEGHVAEADAAAKKIKATAAGAALRGELASRLQRAQARLVELSGWAKWSAEQQREHLMLAAEQLASGSHDVDHLASEVPALREQWKRLHGQAVPVQGEWERFDAALSKAYQPVAARHAEEAARRTQVRSQKEAFCAECEAFVAGIDWEQPDFAAIEAWRGQTLQRWRAAAHAGFKDERALRKRFDAMLDPIEQRLTAARASEVQRREQLIAGAEALRAAPDLRGAMSEAKGLQQRWQGEASALRLARGDEQKMWRRFRAACDAVFARRDAERAEQSAQREKAEQARSALLDAFAANLGNPEPAQVKRALAQFRADWEAAKAAAGAAAPALEQRARALQQQAQRSLEALHKDAHRARLEALARQAAPIEGADPDALEAGRQARESLLIDLEIALDLPTPEQYAAARRRRQLEKLQSRFRGVQPQQQQAEELLARWYATAATADAALDQRVAAVVRRLLEQGRTPAAR
jgi:hypothetical protein